jgi:hypothetical protein
MAFDHRDHLPQVVLEHGGIGNRVLADPIGCHSTLDEMIGFGTGGSLRTIL